MPSRRDLLVGLVVAGLAVPARAAEVEDPAVFLKRLYGPITAGKGDSGGQIHWVEAKARAKIFSASLVKLWDAADAKTPEGDVGAIDFDPFTNSQDPLVKKIDVVVLAATDAKAQLRVTLDEGGASNRPASGDRVLVFDLVREGGGWKIDDIHGSVDGDAWNVRGLLTMR